MAKKTLHYEVKATVGKAKKEIDKTADSVENLNTQADNSKKSFKGFTSIAKGFGTALKGMGIGLVVGALALLNEAMQRNQKVMDTVSTITTTVSNVFGKVVEVLVDTYNWVTKSSDRFNGLTKVLKGLMTIGMTPVKLAFYGIKLAIEEGQLAWEKSFFGGNDAEKIEELRISVQGTRDDIKQVGLDAIESGKAVVNNFGDMVGEVTAIYEHASEGISKINVKAIHEASKVQTELANASKLAEANLVVLIEKNDKLAETQRQIRDNENLTFEERMAANEKLEAILDKQEEDMLALADLKIKSAEIELAANKDNVDLQVALTQAISDRAGVEAQITGFRSEQMTNQVSLGKELLANQNELSVEGMNIMDRELTELKNSYALKLDMARKSGVDTTAITKHYEAQKKQIIMDRVSTELDAAGTVVGALQNLAGENKALARASVVIDTAKGVMKAYGQGGPLGVAGAVLVAAAGMKQLANIDSTQVPSSSLGGQISQNIVQPAQPPAPQMLSGNFALSNNNQNPVFKTFVVTDEITDSQNGLSKIRERATI